MNPELAVDIIPLLLAGAWTTVMLVVQSTILGLVLVALPLGLARHARWPALRWLSKTYDFVFRGIPLIVLLYIVYYGLAAWPPVRETFLWTWFQEPYFCALLALSLNTGAYGAEIVQGAVAAVPRGVVEAARSLGLRRTQTFALITGPIAMRYALAPYAHEVIALTKSTAVVSTITILDLMGMASRVYTETFDAFTPMISAAVIYLALVLALTWAMVRTERRLYRGERRAAPTTIIQSTRESL
jgi:His/Glu/Gln/Arg/opine family amino acid ABC transporter permease subunit